MAKHGENIRKRKDGRWEARVVVPNSGKTKYKSIYAKTYFELKQKIQAKQKITEKSHYFKNMDFEQLCLEWLAAKEMKNKQSTLANYQFIITNHILPYFKYMDINSLQQDHINYFIREKLQNGRLDKKGGLSPKTIHEIIQILKQIIHYGEMKGYLSPVNYEIIKPSVQRKEIQVLTETEQIKLVKYIKANIRKDIKGIGILLSLYAGLRLGEICALQWNDIQLDMGIIYITKTIQRIKNTDDKADTKTKIIIDIPKTQNSVRQIPIPDFLLKEIKRWSKNYLANSYVLTGNTEKYIEPRSYQNTFKRYLKETGIRDINFHALRHTFATRAIEQKVDLKSLSDILGHATINFTLERYVHPSFTQKKQNMEKLAVFY